MIDFDLSFLREASDLIDSKLRSLKIEAMRDEDPDTNGIFDKAEYITGFGLVACQTYITSRIARSQCRRKRALDIGPRHACGVSIVCLVDALANFWKHNSEWNEAPSSQAQATIETISKLGLDHQAAYFAANALAVLVRPSKPSVGRLLPFLKQWNELLLQEPPNTSLERSREG